MQTQHLTIIAVLVPLSWALLAYFIWRGFLRGKKAGYVAGQSYVDVTYVRSIQTLRDDMQRLSNLRREERIKYLNEIQQSEARMAELQERDRLIKPALSTASDIEILVDAAQTLSLALRTWDAIHGTEPIRSRAVSTQRSVTELAARMKNAIDSAGALNETDGTLTARLGGEA